MTDQVSENDRRVRYLVTNPLGQSIFDITFPISKIYDSNGDEVSPVAVYIDGVQTDLFSYSIDDLTITLVPGVVVNSIVVIEGDRLVKRGTGYPLRGGLDSSLLNSDQNAVIQMLQEMRRDIDRCMILNKAEGVGVSSQLPLKSPGRSLKWSDDGLVNSDFDIDDYQDDLAAAESFADVATTKANEALASLEAALVTLSQVQAIYDSFDDRYLGAKTSNPTVDNDGNPLIEGALFYDTVLNIMKIYDLGTTTWNSVTTAVLDGSITTTKLANNAVNSPKLADGAVSTAAKLVDNILTFVKLNTAAIASLADWSAETANKLLTANNFLAAILARLGFNKYFESAELSYTAANEQIVVPHTLVGVPRMWRVVLRCKTAELGYAVDDEVDISMNVDAGNSSNLLSVGVSATQIWLSKYPQIYITLKNGSTAGNTTAANWRVVFRAWGQ